LIKVQTTRSAVTDVEGTDIVIIANTRNIERGVDAARSYRTTVNCALVMIVTIHRGIHARVGDTNFGCAMVVIITVLWSLDTSSSAWITDVRSTNNGCARNIAFNSGWTVNAFVARLRGTCTTCGWSNAGIESARVSVFAVNVRGFASCNCVTCVGGTNVSVITVNSLRIVASSNRIALVLGASISIVASLGGTVTTGSIVISFACVVGTSVSIVTGV